MMNILINKNIEEKRKLMEKLEIHGRHKHKPKHIHEHSDNDKSNKQINMKNSKRKYEEDLEFKNNVKDERNKFTQKSKSKSK